ncbi:MAG: T9SS type A sorting domain-containing protein [Flavobacteriales bacterium]
MKAPLFTVLLTCNLIDAQAQITLQGTAPDPLRSLLSLTVGTKLMSDFEGGPMVTIYNMDLSVYRTLSIPAAPAGYTWSSISYITETLFDTDNTNIEYMLFSSGVNPGDFVTFIVREDGTVLFSAVPGISLQYGSDALNDGPGIFETTDGAVMLMQETFGSPTQLYSLPGHVPCTASCQEAAANFSGFTGVGERSGVTSPNGFPNPADQSATIRYAPPVGGAQAKLILHDPTGRVLLERRLDASGAYVLDTSRLPSGTYEYVITGSGVALAGAKLVVLH